MWPLRKALHWLLHKAPSGPAHLSRVSSRATQTEGAGLPPAMASQGWGPPGLSGAPRPASRVWAGCTSWEDGLFPASAGRPAGGEEASGGPGREGSRHRAELRRRRGAEDRAALFGPSLAVNRRVPPLPSARRRRDMSGEPGAGPCLRGSLSRCWAQPCPHCCWGSQRVAW